jgi:Raf kinase inhibitor-like YbhB/YbcL family protein
VIPNRAIGWTVAALAVIAVTSCDTGDGTRLQPYDPADYPTAEITAAPTTAAPLDTVEAPDPVGDTTDPADITDLFDATGLFTVASSWAEGQPIDSRYTCDGDNVSPAVSWSGIPPGTVEMALALVDDSAVSDGQPFVHWVIAGLDPAQPGIGDDDIPEGAVQALNAFGTIGYRGPCPTAGSAPHLYRLTAFALNTRVEGADGTPATEFLETIGQVTIGSTDLTATYQR